MTTNEQNPVLRKSQRFIRETGYKILSLTAKVNYGSLWIDGSPVLPPRGVDKSGTPCVGKLFIDGGWTGGDTFAAAGAALHPGIWA